MGKRIPKPLEAALILSFAGILVSGPAFARGGTLLFSKAQHLLTLPWSNGSNHGIPITGPEWLIAAHGRFYLESNLDFDVYDSKGQHLRTLDPIDKSKNFFGFSTMEALPDGQIALLARLESPQEQWGKDDFEEHSKPGARLIVLGIDGQGLMDKELADPEQPHSNYYMENGVVYSVHEDGTYRVLESAFSSAPQDRAFGNFAAVAYNLERWMTHIKDLPVFKSGDKTYHDTKGHSHEIKGAASFLMGQTLVEGLGPLAERAGKIYYSVVFDKNQDFINAVFVEDPQRKDYGIVDLLHADEDLDIAHGHTTFVDPKGNIFEGVGKKDGYRIYEWKILP